METEKSSSYREFELSRVELYRKMLRMIAFLMKLFPLFVSRSRTIQLQNLTMHLKLGHQQLATRWGHITPQKEVLNAII